VLELDHHLKGLQTGALSRFINGQRDPSEEQLYAICEASGIGSQAYPQFYTALLADRSAKHHRVGSMVIRLDVFMDECQNDYLSAYNVKREGNPWRALDIAMSLSRKLQNAIARLDRTTDPSGSSPLLSGYLQQARRLLADALIQIADCHRHIFLPDDIMISAEAISSELQMLAVASGDDEVMGFADLVLGYGYAHTTRYQQAVASLEQALDRITDDDYRLEGLRGLALSHAHLHNEDQFIEAERRAIDIIDEGRLSKIEILCEAYEGIGWGYGLLGSEKAFGRLKDAEQAYREHGGDDKSLPVPRVLRACPVKARPLRAVHME
jgi:tetratricopeptide (TPR) repeat protein